MLGVLALLLAITLMECMASRGLGEKISLIKKDQALAAQNLQRIKNKAERSRYQTLSEKSDLDSRKTEIRGLITQNNKRAILIEGTLYHEGDTFEGYTVVSITPDTVQLKNPETLAVRYLYLSDQ